MSFGETGFTLAFFIRVVCCEKILWEDSSVETSAGNCF